MTVAAGPVAPRRPGPVTVVDTGDVREDAGRRGVWGHWDSAVTSYYLVLGATCLLVTIGVVMVLSSSSVRSLTETDGASPYRIFAAHAQFALLGLPLMIVASRLPVRFWKRVAWPALGLALVLQSLVFVPGLGRTVNGNRAWIEVLGQRFQPAEAAKLALALWLGVVLARKRHLLGDWRHLIPPALGVVAVLGLVLAGHDLGTAIVILVLAAGAFFVAGLPLRWFALAGVLATAVVVHLARSSENRVGRILSFFSPECDQLGACYQTTRGLYGLGSGGVLGLGLGESREKWAYLPEAHNDFIFAILGEELGLLGTLLVVALFGVLAVAVARVVRRHPDPFVQVAAGAIGVWVLGQAVVNMAVVVGLLPVVGVPLPLVSAGGSALVVTLGALGVLLAFARDEPGAREALTARAGAVRRSLAVLGRTRGGQ